MATLEETVQDERFMALYNEWLEHPVTRQLKQVLTQHIKPGGLARVVAEEALYEHGRCAGRNDLFSCTFELVEMADRAKKSAAAGSVQPDYGSDTIIAAYKKGES